MLSSILTSISAGAHWRVIVTALLLATFAPTVWALDEKGCEGVEFARRPTSQYSLSALKQRLERDPADVDALIHLGIYEDEQGQTSQAEALYDSAIHAKPSCYLGFYFSGMIRNRISSREYSRAEADIRKALTLNPDLRSDGNVQSFVSAHPDLWGVRPAAAEVEESWSVRRVYATANHFTAGFGVGVLAATLILYLTRRGRAVPKRVT